VSDEVAEASARLGQVLNDKWTLERLLGLGGMAAVYAARHRNGARAALKLLHAHFAKDDAVRGRFLREGYAANRVEHPGAVRVLDDDSVSDGPDRGAAYIVMELLDGESLEERAAHPPPIDEVEFLTIADAVLAVLAAAHENGVVHRDLKPANIFLAKDEDGHRKVKLLDFGLARLTMDAVKSQFGLALGTPSYMSPEQAGGRTNEIDGRTDIFALGATGFRLLTGRRIHEAEDMPLLIAMANDPAPRVRDVCPRVSERVAAILDRAIAFRREDRYSTATEMRADVQAALDLATSAAAEPSAPADDGDSSELPAGVPRRRGWILPLFGAAVVVAGSIFYVSRRPHFEGAGAEEDRAADVTNARDAGVDARAPQPHPSVSTTGKPAPKANSSPKKSPATLPTTHKTR
jgi:serine/threonine-protein kinase